MFLFIIEVVRGFGNIEVASSLSTEMYVYVCVARIACAADQPTNRGAGHSRGRAAGRPRGRTGAAAGRSSGAADDEAPFLSYGDEDVPNVLPRFDSSKVGFHFPGYLTRGSLEGAKDFFDLFFDDSIVNSIVTHTNSYAQEKVFSGQGSLYYHLLFRTPM